MEPEPFPVVEDAAQFRGEVAQRIVRELHRMGWKAPPWASGRPVCPCQERIGIATVSEVRPKPDMSWIAAILGTGLRMARLREKAWAGEKSSSEGFPPPNSPFPIFSACWGGRAPIVFQEAKVSHTVGGKSSSRKGHKNDFR